MGNETNDIESTQNDKCFSDILLSKQARCKYKDLIRFLQDSSHSPCFRFFPSVLEQYQTQAAQVTVLSDFSQDNERVHWLIYGRMTSNKQTVSRQRATFAKAGSIFDVRG